MSKLNNNPLDLKGSLLKTKENNNFNFDLSQEISTSNDITQEIIKPKEKEQPKVAKAKEAPKKQKTYRLSQKILDDIEKIVYMDRELRGSETTLITKAIESYIYSKEGKELIKQYDELKGNK